jgi:hypothetical protein
MKTADEAEALLSRLTRGEKARLLQRVAQDLGDAYPSRRLTYDRGAVRSCTVRPPAGRQSASLRYRRPTDRAEVPDAQPSSKASTRRVFRGSILARVFAPDAVPTDLTARAAAARRTPGEANRSASCATRPSVDAAA